MDGDKCSGHEPAALGPMGSWRLSEAWRSAARRRCGQQGQAAQRKLKTRAASPPILGKAMSAFAVSGRQRPAARIHFADFDAAAVSPSKAKPFTS